MQLCVDVSTVAQGGWGKQAGTADRPVTDKTWDYAIYCTFDTVSDHDAYQVDPKHDIFVNGCKHMWEKVTIMDVD